MHMIKLSLGFFVGLVLSGSVLAQACTPKVSAEHLTAPGKLQMSTNLTLPPQQFVDSKGELQGLNIELGRAVAKSLCCASNPSSCAWTCHRWCPRCRPAAST